MSARRNALTIRTPEGVAFSLVLAGPVSRLLALSVDAVVVATAGSILGTIASVLMALSPSLGMALVTLAYFVFSVGYGIALEWAWQGQTLGKRLLRLRVMDARGLRLTFSQVAMRNLLRVVDSLPLFYLVGGAVCLLSPLYQRLGDIAAATVVVREPKIAPPDVEQLMSGRFNSFLDHPHLCARLRQKVSPAEAELVLQALVRRETLEPMARLETYSALAARLRALVPFPEEAVEGLTEEQYLRNAVAVLYRTRSNGKAERVREPGPRAE